MFCPRRNIYSFLQKAGRPNARALGTTWAPRAAVKSNDFRCRCVAVVVAVKTLTKSCMFIHIYMIYIYI